MTTTEATTSYLRTRILTPAMRSVLPCPGGEWVEALSVVTDWVAPWSEENATRFCNESFTQDIAVSTCIEKVNTSVSEYIASCVEDIKACTSKSFHFSDT
uniref:Vwde helical domain-containing protein n=1 Tax=Magallana gigas TaxID=29159 RepID=K1QG00_MAGGI